MKIAVEVQYTWLLIQPSQFYPAQLCAGRTTMQHLVEPSMPLMLIPSYTALRSHHILLHMYQEKIVSFNFLARIYPMALMSNLLSRTTLLMMQEVCYMVVQ